MKRRILQALLEARAAKRPVVMATELETGRQLLLDGDAALGELEDTPALRLLLAERLAADEAGPSADGKLFVQPYLPPLRLMVVGAVHIAQSLVPMAMLAGFETIVVDPRRAWATETRFPGVRLVFDWPDDALEALAPDVRTAVVTLTHDPKLDDPALVVALRSPAFYIGALGSTRTQAKRLDRLREEGVEEAVLGRIHGPIGLKIGARSPAEIALSILGQITAVRRGAAQ